MDRPLTRLGEMPIPKPNGEQNLKLFGIGKSHGSLRTSDEAAMFPSQKFENVRTCTYSRTACGPE